MLLQMQQKHQVQDLLAEALPGATTTLQATLFMEELWKRYTRPKVRPPPWDCAYTGGNTSCSWKGCGSATPTPRCVQLHGWLALVQGAGAAPVHLHSRSAQSCQDWTQ
jgi:hypothetical protein